MVMVMMSGDGRSSYNSGNGTSHKTFQFSFRFTNLIPVFHGTPPIRDKGTSLKGGQSLCNHSRNFA